MLGDSKSDQERMMEEQSKQERHMAMQSQPDDHNLGLDDYMQMIRSDISGETLEILDMLIAKDFALGNLSEADINELKWLREITKIELQCIHPDEHTAMQGEVRELVYTNNGKEDVEALPLEPLSEYERLRIDEILRAAHLMASRSKGGFQWDQVAKSYSVSEIRDQDDDESGWLDF